MARSPQGLPSEGPASTHRSAAPPSQSPHQGAARLRASRTSLSSPRADRPSGVCPWPWRVLQPTQRHAAAHGRRERRPSRAGGDLLCASPRAPSGPAVPPVVAARLTPWRAHHFRTRTTARRPPRRPSRSRCWTRQNTSPASCRRCSACRSPGLLPLCPTPLTPCIHAPRNLVATVNLDCKLDLKTITLHARNAEYNPKVLRD